MSKRRRRRKNQPDDVEVAQIREKIAEKTIWAIAILVFVLVIGLLVLVFRIGESVYPVLVIENRNPTIEILLSIIIVVILSSPLIVEANSNTRRLSGPGKNPHLDLWK